MTARITPEAAQRHLDAGLDLTAGELAAIVGMHRQTIIRYLDNGLELTSDELPLLIGTRQQEFVGRRWIPPHGRTPGGHRTIPPSTARRFVEVVLGRRAGVAKVGGREADGRMTRERLTGTVGAAGTRAAHDQAPATRTPASTPAGRTPPAVSFLQPEI